MGVAVPAGLADAAGVTAAGAGATAGPGVLTIVNGGGGG